MPTALDYSFSRFTPAQIKFLGVIGAIRYLGEFTSSKVMDKAEYDQLIAGGILVAGVVEFSATDWMKGYDTGFLFGRAGRLHARQLGIPDDRPLYLAFDTDIQPSQLPVAIAHMTGFNDGGGVPAPYHAQAAYGTCFLIKELLIRGLIRDGWQSMSTGFHDNAQPCAQASAIQLPPSRQPSDQYDINTLQVQDWGQMPTTLAPGEMDRLVAAIVHQLIG